jgi:hypothetical protein
MRLANKFSVGAALIGSVLLSFAGAAQAQDHYDRDHYDRDHRVDHRYDHRYEDHRFVEQRPVYIAPRPVFVAPPVVMAPPVPSSLNLNFNVPL